MDCQELLQALALALGALFPARKVYHREIPQGADNSFSIGVTNLSQSKALGRRFVRTVTLEVRYFLVSRSTEAYIGWAETMLDSLRILENDQWCVRVENPRAQGTDSGEYYRFTFDVTMYLREEPSAQEVMETLYLYKTAL